VTPVSKAWARKCRRHYRRIIEPLRIVARECGYALAVHGSLRRDIDLVGVPWAADAKTPRQLADAIAAKLVEMGYGWNGEGEVLRGWTPGKDQDFTLDGAPGVKPHGRLGWVIHLGGGPYIDLAVFPPKEAAK
jgi:hypothetical protein